MSTATQRPAKPPKMQVIVDNIPAELRELRRWVVWKWKWNGKKYDKPPLMANGKNASSADPETWTTFQTAAKVALMRFDGVGFTLRDSGFVGVDLDDCRDSETGEIFEPASSIIRKLDTYAEVSPSGKGVKLLCKATLPQRRQKVQHKVNVEVYDKQYFTITGNRVPGTPATVNERQQQVEWLLSTWVDTQKHNTNGRDSKHPMDDIELARSALDGLPNAGEGLGYDDWLRVGMALHSVSDQLFPEFDRWSRQSTKYTEAKTAKTWASFHGNGVGLGTLIHMAKQDGWTPPRGTHGSKPHATAPKDADDSTLTVANGRTEAANAARLVVQCGQDVRWCDPWGKWLIWDGKRWKIDDQRRIDTLAKSVADDLWTEAAAVATDADEKTIKAIWRFVGATNQATGIRNMVALARSDVAILPSALDTDPWLLNLDNGTLELRTGELRPHSKHDWLTKVSPVVYDGGAECPTWRAFLATITNNDLRLVAYLQRLVGYCLTGTTLDHVLPFLYGIGSNGKSTFINAILALLGEDYAIKAPTDLLLTKKDQHPTERADLFGKRFVACVEAEDGRRLAESLVKELTGGDKIRARRMREDFWEFTATHKIWLAANHKPTVRGSDHGIWRRIKLVPFTVVIPDNQQDKLLPAKLAAELPGILRWALHGCQEWQRVGLGEPDTVKAATGGYREEMDLVGRFLTECCVLEPGRQAGATRLYKAFKAWCEDTGEHAINQMRFGSRLSERGYENERTRTGFVRHGIGLPEEV